MTRALALALVAATGCEPIAAIAQPDAPDAADAPDAPLGADAALGPTVACASDIAQCLYQPAPLPFEQMVVTLHYDTSGGVRDVPIEIRFAPTAPQPMPIVVWSHGGGTGLTDPTVALPEWAVATAAAGYFTISIAHEARDGESLSALCKELHIDPLSCPSLKSLDYDRPLDIQLVIATINTMSTTGPFAGHLDTTKIAIAGHAAGAGGALMIDDVPRDISGQNIVLASPQPVAFIALSPQAPGSAGFSNEGYARITRPTMIATGRGDNNGADTADGRALVFDLMKPGGKARLFVEDPAAMNSVFALDTTDCAATAPVDHCQQMTEWVKSSVIAFLDAQLRQSADAVLWVSSTNLAIASANVAEWSTK